MSGLFAGTPLERPVTCEICGRAVADCICPRDADGRVLRPGDQTAIIRRAKRRKGKVVTLVEGLAPVATDLPGLLKRLKTLCGAGGTVADGILEVQGEHREKVAADLRKLGYKVKVGWGG